MSPKEVPLSAVDHIFTGEGAYPIQFLLVFPGRIDAARLKSAFIDTLENFWPLSSVLEKRSDRYWLSYQKDYFQFEIASLEKEIDIDNPAEVPTLFLPVETFPGEVLTKVKCWWGENETYLAISVAHCVGDGYSFFYFLSAWCAAFHGQPIPLANHDRTVLIPKELGTAINPELFWKSMNMVWGEPRPSIRSQKLRWEVIPFSRARLQELKTEARATTARTLTDNDYLVADLTRQIFREGSGVRFVSCVVDYRRIHPQLSKLYFGNAIRGAAFETSAEAVRTSSLGALSEQNRLAVNAVDFSAVQQSLVALETLLKQEGVDIFQSVAVADPVRGLLVTNLSRVPLFSIDFGTGSARAIRSATPTPRAAIVFPSGEGLAVVYNYPVE